MRSRGIFGGTFDPIHHGHLRTAFEILERLSLDEMRFVPCGHPPHRGGTVASERHRLRMVAAAVADNPRFVVDERELRRKGPSYSVDTLLSMRDEYLDDSLALVVGMDAFLALPSWHRWDELLELGHLVVAHRPGWELPVDGQLGDLLARHRAATAEDITTLRAGCIFVHPVTQLEISATGIRSMVAEGRDPVYLVPDAVRDLIARCGCYAANE